MMDSVGAESAAVGLFRSPRGSQSVKLEAAQFVVWPTSKFATGPKEVKISSSTTGRNQTVTAYTSIAAPQAIAPTPASRPTQDPNGNTFSISTNTASAAIQNRFMIPPTNSNPIRNQQQPRQ